MNNLEVEIAELQKMIEAKRDELEKSGGIVEEKDLVRQSVKEIFLGAKAPSTSTPANSDQSQTASLATQTVPANASYLDYRDDQTAEIIYQLIADVSTKGITPVINGLGTQEPFVVDAFHDALVDKLYDELKMKGFVK